MPAQLTSSLANELTK